MKGFEKFVPKRSSMFLNQVTITKYGLIYFSAAAVKKYGLESQRFAEWYIDRERGYLAFRFCDILQRDDSMFNLLKTSLSFR